MKEYLADPDFLDLIAALHENREFSEERMTELSARLEADADLRSALAAEIQMAALTEVVQSGESRWLKLEEKLQPNEGSSPEHSHEEAVMHRVREHSANRKMPSRLSLWSLTIGIAALALGMAFFLFKRTDGDTTSVARVIRIDGDLHTSEGRKLLVNDRLQPDESLAMSQGQVEIAFVDTGVHLLATAPLSLTTLSRDRIFVNDGEVKLHVPPQGIGFIVETPDQKITDLGTSFVLTSRKSGSRVLVLDGQISVANRKDGKSKLMNEGDLADIDQSGSFELRSREPSRVPELTQSSLTPTPSSLPGRLLAFEVLPNEFHPQIDFIGPRFLPLIQSGFQDESGLTGLKQSAPIRFTGIAGTYNAFPENTNLKPFAKATGWIAWYRGKVLPPRPGRYRFRGYADNHLLVAVNGKAIFEGSRYSSALREKLNITRRNHPSLPCLNSTAGFASGEWFEVGSEPVQIDLLFGEQGGNFTCGILLLEREGEVVEETYWSQPKWPLFLTESPGEPEIVELENLRDHMEKRMMGSFSIDPSSIWQAVENY